MKPKVLFILHLPPPIHGAAVVSQIISKSDRINFEFNCRFINLSTSRSIGELGSWGILKWIRYMRILAIEFFQLIYFRPDLVYITLNAKGTGFYKDSLVALLAKFFAKNVVYHFHNKGVHQNQFRFFDNLLYELIFRSSSIILLSDKLYFDISKYVSESNVYYCRNGVEGFLESAHFPNPKSNSSITKLLFLSNLITSKGVFILLEACFILKEKNIPFTCSFVGGIGDISELEFNEEVARLNLMHIVSYKGEKFGDDKLSELYNSDIFVLPTYNDCFPLVLIEAMVFGLPIISTNHGAISDIVQDNFTGYLINERNSKSLAEKLEILILDPHLRKKFGAAGRKKYDAQFTYSHFENNFINILQEIV